MNSRYFNAFIGENNNIRLSMYRGYVCILLFKKLTDRMVSMVTGT